MSDSKALQQAALDARALSLKRPVSLPLMRSLLEENLALF